MGRLRQAVLRWVEAPRFGHAVIGLILLNAVILGAETVPSVLERHGGLLFVLDRILLAIFVVELVARLFAHGRGFFRDPWAVFDAAVVMVALVPASGALSILRALRVLRVLRLISALPRLRRVVEGLLAAIPGLGSIVGVLLILVYVFAVMATKLYGAEYPEWFGTLPAALFTLFQIMTLEGWADIAREMMRTHPTAWLFLLCYILLSTFTVLNFFIAVIVDSMQKTHSTEEDRTRDSLDAIQADLAALRRDLARLDITQLQSNPERRGA